MNADERDDAGPPQESELIRRICDEESPGAPGLGEPPAAEGNTRQAIEELRALVRELRGALAPEPLPEPLVRRIRAQLAQSQRRHAAPILRLLPWAGLAAAAVAIAMLLPWNLPPRTPEAALTADDAADIVAAYGVLTWSGPLENSIERVSTRLQQVEQQLERTPDTGSSLPWQPADDWDRPSANRGGWRPPAEPTIYCVGELSKRFRLA